MPKKNKNTAEVAAVENTNISGRSHCEDMDSDMSSMMSSRDIGIKVMM